MAPRPNPAPDADSVVIQAERRDIEEVEIRPTLAKLMSLLDADNVRDHLERVDLCVSGYDSDPRDPCEIPDVREWMAALDKAFPYWFAFLNKQSHSLGFVTCALCSCVKEGGCIFPDPDSFVVCTNRQYAALRELVDRGVISEEESQAILDHVADYHVLRMMGHPD